MLNNEKRIKYFKILSVFISFILVFCFSEIFVRYKYLGFDGFTFGQDLFKLKNWHKSKINWHYMNKNEHFGKKWPVEIDSDLGWKLRPSQKIKDGINKVLSRKSLIGICPKEILEKKQKIGFNAPFDIYLKFQLKDFVLDVFHSKSFNERGIYDNKKFKKILSEHLKGQENHMMLLWQAINLELWMCSWVDK